MRIKKIMLWTIAAIFGYLLAASLLFLTSAVVFSSIGAKPEKVKTILRDSGVYQKTPGVLYDSVEQENRDRQTDIDLSDPAVKQAALDSFSPAFFETSAEAALDGTYGWLEGKTSQAEFVVDASGPKNKFIGQVVDIEVARVNKLPVCSFAQLRQIDPRSVDIYNLDCLPPGINVDAAAKTAKAELKNNQEFLGDTKLDARDIKNQSGQPLLGADSSLPKNFRLAKNLAWLLAVLSILLATGIYLASPDKRKGSKQIAKILIGVGFLTLLAPIVIKFLNGKLLPAVSPDKLVSEIITPVIRQFNSAAAPIYYLLGGIMLAAGILLVVLIYKNIIKFPEAKKS